MTMIHPIRITSPPVKNSPEPGWKMLKAPEWSTFIPWPVDLASRAVSNTSNSPVEAWVPKGKQTQLTSAAISCHQLPIFVRQEVPTASESVNCKTVNAVFPNDQTATQKILSKATEAASPGSDGASLACVHHRCPITVPSRTVSCSGQFDNLWAKPWRNKCQTKLKNKSTIIYSTSADVGPRMSMQILVFEACELHFQVEIFILKSWSLLVALNSFLPHSRRRRGRARSRAKRARARWARKPKCISKPHSNPVI